MYYKRYSFFSIVNCLGIAMKIPEAEELVPGEEFPPLGEYEPVEEIVELEGNGDLDDGQLSTNALVYEQESYINRTYRYLWRCNLTLLRNDMDILMYYAAGNTDMIYNLRNYLISLDDNNRQLPVDEGRYIDRVTWETLKQNMREKRYGALFTRSCDRSSDYINFQFSNSVKKFERSCKQNRSPGIVLNLPHSTQPSTLVHAVPSSHVPGRKLKKRIAEFSAYYEEVSCFAFILTSAATEQ
ncbi:hypothetical protein CEXT_273611 [Caerostris extrusa]|uniref:Uncharacterized protein n=1 Tax=Caerostris extrusa TaxID=172846 RepID=A0AAV4WF51_CAEEX|nr:hypothetical protein CEXT_273611 [Caerostris extrusa]